jgi:hypothetical protein
VSTHSDPALPVAQRRAAQAWTEANAAAFAVAPNPHQTVARSLRQRVLAYSALAVGTSLAGLRLIASVLAQPLDSVDAASAPAWMVEVTTTSALPGTALVFGREVGFQLVQVPAGDGAKSNLRVVPARLARGELHLLSLGLSSLRVHTVSPPGTPKMSFAARARVITLYQKRDITGVRAGW